MHVASPNMAGLLAFVLVCYGMTNILTTSKLLEVPRKSLGECLARRAPWAETFPECPMCVGFWVGILVSLLWLPVTNWFLDGCLSSGTCWLIEVWVIGRGGDEL